MKIMATWSTAALGELVELRYGKAFKAEDRPVDGVFPIYGSNGIIGKSHTALVRHPTIIIGRKGAVGEAHLAANGCWPIDTTFYTVTLSDKGIDLRYLLLWLHSIDLKKLAITSTIPGINRDTLYAQRLPLPPLTEQERLVRLLDEADALRRLRTRANSRMDAFVPALFHEIFGDPARNEMGWPRVTMEDATNIDAEMVDPREEQYLDLPHIGPERIEKETGKLLQSRTAREDGLISGKYLFDTRHVLYSKIRPYLRKVAIPLEPGLCSADVYPIRPIAEKLTREYLWALLLSKAFTDYTLGLSVRANMPKVNREQLHAYEMMLPPLSLQHEFAVRVAETRALEEKQAQSAARLGALFESMLAKAFAGEL